MRIGVPRSLRKYLSDAKFRQAISGLFTSKLIYCISVWAGVWNIPGQLQEHCKPSISKEDMRRLQTLQNKVLRMLTRSDRLVSTDQLMTMSNSLSVHQLGAYHIALQVFKTYRTGKPVYHYNKLFGQQQHQSARSAANMECRVNYRLSTSRGSFFFQAARLWTALPTGLKISTSVSQFKTGCRKWIRSQIGTRP